MPGISPAPDPPNTLQEPPSNSREPSRTAHPPNNAREPSPSYPKPSLRWDAAQRACRDGDLKTLKYVIQQARIFDDAPSLRQACLSGAWGTGKPSLQSGTQPYTTQDSIRLHTLLQTATTRNRVPIVHYLLTEFPAKDLHVLEWEVVVNAVATGEVELLREFVSVDEGVVRFWRRETGNLFAVLFELAEREGHAAVVRFLLEKGADPDFGGCEGEALELAREKSTEEVVGMLEEHLQRQRKEREVDTLKEI